MKLRCSIKHLFAQTRLLSLFTTIFLIYLIVFSCSETEYVKYEMQDLKIEIDQKGQIIGIIDKKTNQNYCPENLKSPLVSLKIDSTIVFPAKIVFKNGNQEIQCSFENGVQIGIKAISLDKYITFECVSVSSDLKVDAIIWGPYASTIKGSIGETIGIAQNKSFTFGLQALNPKTLGGYPWKDNDHLPQLDIFEQDDFSDVEKGKRGVLYSVEAAKPTKYGSSLQAYTRNRINDRIIKNLNHDKYLAPAYDDGGIVGSKIALFACETDSCLSTIGQIEIAEGLPHPSINGEWTKTSKTINSSYLIMNFSEQNIDECIEYTKKSGFNYLYHGHPFSSWGHIPLSKEMFPNGIAGMKECVRKAESQGIYIGTHTLTNFISTNDNFVTPVPDKRLAKVGSSFVVAKIDEKQTEIEIENPDFFNQFRNNHLRAVVIEDEIITYGSISENPLWILKNCTRGAFGTNPVSHDTKTKISKLADHGYKVFLGDASLNKEMAEIVADFMNQTGVRMLDFDGLEGTHSSGMGNYAEALFAQDWFDKLDENIKSHFLLGASRSGHYFWHIYSRMNWGEPWYAGFRESQTEYRLLNQKYFKRNLMPGMLGWFKMTPETTVEDIEWLMARSAGYDAGFAFYTNLETLRKNGNTEQIFAILNIWETARLNDVFDENLKNKMKDISTEFRLKKSEDKDLILKEIYSHKYTHRKKIKQPGEPLFSTFKFENKCYEQTLKFIITAENADISNIKIEINNQKSVELPIDLKSGQTIKTTEDRLATIYDKNWNIVSEVKLDTKKLIIPTGQQSVNFDCSFKNPQENAAAKIEFLVYDRTEKI